MYMYVCMYVCMMDHNVANDLIDSQLNSKDDDDNDDDDDG